MQLNESWLLRLQNDLDAEYMAQLNTFLAEEKDSDKVIYPPEPLILNALNSIHFDNTKLVILGQDPYHGPGQAHGLCFSVPLGVRPPPSLVNIFKEVHRDLSLPIPEHGCLDHWAKQGVLLLNSVLTVEHKKAGSHVGKGWEVFTDSVIHCLNTQREGIVFMLWGNYAHKKGRLIDSNKHLVLKSVHPSPLSAHRGFLGCSHFSQANAFLRHRGEREIDWSLP